MTHLLLLLLFLLGLLRSLLLHLLLSLLLAILEGGEELGKKAGALGALLLLGLLSLVARFEYATSKTKNVIKHIRAWPQRRAQQRQAQQEPRW